MDAAALVAFGVFALLDWLAVSRGIRALEYVAKPATLLALLAYAAFGHASPWLVAALVFSLLGDIFLMLPADLFLAGLAAFLIAHLAYIGAFAGALVPRLLWLAVVLVVLAPVAVRILHAVPERAKIAERYRAIGGLWVEGCLLRLRGRALETQSADRCRSRRGLRWPAERAWSSRSWL